jgi:hypothetical protein
MEVSVLRGGARVRVAPVLVSANDHDGVVGRRAVDPDNLVHNSCEAWPELAKDTAGPTTEFWPKQSKMSENVAYACVDTTYPMNGGIL